jgi:hypothetical protein
MSNPLFQKNNDVPNGKTVPHSKQVEQKTKTNVKMSKFNLDHVILDTLRYGEYKPFVSLPVVPHDSVKMSSIAEVRSDTLESPMLSGISINQDYIYCPLSAIIPRSFEYAMTTPAFGDDVPDNVFPSISLQTFDSFISGFITRFNDLFGDPASRPTTVTLNECLYMLMLSQMLFSSGSLLNSLGYNIPVYILNNKASSDNSDVDGYDIDQYFDYFNATLASKLKRTASITISDPSDPSKTISYYYSKTPFNNPPSRSNIFFSAIEFVKFIYHCMQNGSLIDFSLGLTFSDINDLVFNVTLKLDSQVSSPSVPSDVVELSYDSLTLMPIFAYKAFVSQFCVNQSVDKVYTFELWQANMKNIGRSLINTATSVQPTAYYVYNGTEVLYDYLSGAYYQQYFVAANTLISSKTKNLQTKLIAFTFLFNLLGFDNSLIYEDRFAGSRVSSLGIEGSADILLGETPDAVDVSRSVTFYKFRNKVAKLKNSFSRQLAGFFGVSETPDFHYPQYLAGTSSAVSGFEVANTADEQGKQVTRLNSKTSNFAFQADVTYHGYILGLASFSMPFAYSRGVSRDVFHATRWDMFNPDFQGLGDDTIRLPEVIGYSSRSAVNSPFAYENRDNFYKMPISKARGAFTSQLKSWAFVIDQNNNISPNVRYPYFVLSPEFLRCCPLDADRFFTFFGNTSYSNWFHFIVKFNNKIEISRNMIKYPNITLG